MSVRDHTSSGQLSRLFRDVKTVRGVSDPISHTLFTGGKFYVPHGKCEEYFEALERDILEGNVPSASEVHTLVFPFFCDFDCPLPVRALPREVVLRIARVINAQVARFFPSADASSIECLVLQKRPDGIEQMQSAADFGLRWHEVDPDDASLRPEHEVHNDRLASALAFKMELSPSELDGLNMPEGALTWDSFVRTMSGAVVRPSGKWKHGLHVHWPRLHVDVGRALQIRAGILSGLDRISWKWELGVDRPDWDAIVDEGVYQASDRGGGLRVVGAPKAKKCKACTPADQMCPVCLRANNRHIVDVASVYVPTVWIVGEGERNVQALAVGRLVRKTTVRCWTEAPRLTTGYAVYQGCPPLSDASRKRSAGGGAKKRGAASVAGGDLPCKLRRLEDVSDSEVLAIARRLVAAYSDKYKDARVSVRRAPTKYVVVLSGDGATFCLNKGGYHNSQRVYMEVRKHLGEYHTFMHCWCKCKVLRSTGVTCGSASIVRGPIRGNDLAILFPTTASSKALDADGILAALSKRLNGP